MKRRYRQRQIITIIALVVVMLGLSVGYAAFTNVLTIGTTAAVKPDSSTFSVLFSSSGTSQSTSAISGTGSGGATGGSASISGTTISGLKANFTAPGQSVTYTFYSHNVGSFVAYLRNVKYGSGKTCTAGTNTNSDMVNAACDDITVSVSVGENTYSANNTNVYSHSLAIDAYEMVKVTITYASDGDVADGEFSVAFGDVSLTYSSVDGELKLITFTMRGETYTAEEGMTWREFIDSNYGVGTPFGVNTNYTNELVYYGQSNIYFSGCTQTYIDETIVANHAYGDYASYCA